MIGAWRRDHVWRVGLEPLLWIVVGEGLKGLIILNRGRDCFEGAGLLVGTGAMPRFLVGGIPPVRVERSGRLSVEERWIRAGSFVRKLRRLIWKPFWLRVADEGCRDNKEATGPHSNRA